MIVPQDRRNKPRDVGRGSKHVLAKHVLANALSSCEDQPSRMVSSNVDPQQGKMDKIRRYSWKCVACRRWYGTATVLAPSAFELSPNRPTGAGEPPCLPQECPKSLPPCRLLLGSSKTIGTFHRDSHVVDGRSSGVCERQGHERHGKKTQTRCVLEEILVGRKRTVRDTRGVQKRGRFRDNLCRSRDIYPRPDGQFSKGAA